MNPTQPNLSRLAFFFDDPPVEHSSRSLGLSPINTRLASLLRPSLIVYNKSRVWRDQEIYINPNVPSLEVFGGKAISVINTASRSGDIARDFAEYAILRMKRLPLHTGIDWTLAPVGSDLSSIRHAIAVKRRLGSRLILYMVDDPLSAIREFDNDQESIRLRESLTAMLSQADIVCAITPELAQLLGDHYNGLVGCLPLPYVRDANIFPRTIKNQIIYVGSVNQIYRAELDYWIKSLRAAGFFDDGNILITGDYEESPGVVVRKFAARKDLEQEIADSRACLLPVSSRDSRLCFTSFPSKTLDYLAYSPLVLASSPKGSVIDGFFRSNSLPKSYREGQVDINEVLDILAAGVNLQEEYHRVLDKSFSIDVFVKCILDMISDFNVRELCR